MSKELLFKVLRHEDAERVPWVPFAGVHAGKLKGYNAQEVLTDGDKLFESLMEVNKLYQPDGMPIAFDLQIEAEVLGCKLLWADYNPPSVRKHPYMRDGSGVPTDDMIPTKESGRIPLILDVMKRTKAAIGDQTALYGLITGPLTLASHLRGSDFFMDMVADKDYVKAMMAFCTKVAIAMCDYYIEAGMDVIAVVDPLVSQVSPKSFDELLGDSFKEVFDYIRSKGVFSAFFVCGNASAQIEVMCKTGPDSIHVDENVDLPKAKETTDLYNIVLGGNIPLTTTMLFGNQMDNMKCVIDIYDSIANKRNFILSPGCDMPYDVPIENTIAVTQAVLRTEEIREQVANYEAVDEDVEVDIPDYASLDKVLIELFLLDPDQCAACTYMLRSVTDNYDDIKDIADYAEYRYCVREDIPRYKAMGLSKLPTMTLDGEPKFISIIPTKDELIAAVKEAYAKKH